MSALESAAKGPGERSSLAQVAARGVSQRGGASRCGSESERGTRLAVEALWPSREPVRRRRRSPSERKRRLSAGNGPHDQKRLCANGDRFGQPSIRRFVRQIL